MKVYKFYAEWCNPCKSLSKKLESSDICDKITAIDCDNDTDGLCDKYSIKSVPTIVFTDDEGNELDRLIGNVSVADIKNKISLLS